MMVLEPLKLEKLNQVFDEISISSLNFFIKKLLFSIPELKINQSKIPIQVTKEHIEQWFVQSLKNASSVGSGSYPVDLVSEKDKWCADAKMLKCKIDKNFNLKNSDSGETSISQKFNDENFGNKTLDELFRDQRYNHIWGCWKNIIIDKYEPVYKVYKPNNIYYFFILNAETKFHICAFELKLGNINNTKINIERSTNTSIWIDKFINDNYGHIKIYKSKKRVELRLKPKFLVENNLVKTIDLSFDQKNVDIRDLIKKHKTADYINNLLKRIFDQ